MIEKRSRIIRRASILAMAGNGLLALAKLWVGLSSQTLSVLGDGVDSAIDVITSSIPLFASRIMDKKPNREYPFGYGRVESTASLLLSFVIFYAGLELGISGVKNVLNPQPFTGIASLALWVTLASIVGKVLLAALQIHQGKKVASPMLMANGKNMLADILISVSVLAGLLASKFTKNPYVDGLITIFIALVIMKTAASLFMENNKELIDGIEDTDVYKQISDLAVEVDGVTMPHRIRARKVGIRLMVYLDIELPPQMTVHKAHEISKEVEDKIRQEMEGIYDVVVHIEPEGNVEDETYGVCIEEREEDLEGGKIN